MTGREEGVLRARDQGSDQHRRQNGDDVQKDASVGGAPRPHGALRPVESIARIDIRMLNRAFVSMTPPRSIS